MFLKSLNKIRRKCLSFFQEKNYLFQTRSDENGLRFFASFQDALDHAQYQTDVWKISFTHPQSGDHIRLIRTDMGWLYESIYGVRF